MQILPFHRLSDRFTGAGMLPALRATIAAGALAGCLGILPGAALAQSSFDREVDYYEDASKRASQNDSAGAIIQLKNALQLNQDHTPSMLLLGELLLQLGEASQAAAVLSEALLLGADNRSTTPLLIEAYLRTNDFGSILTKLPYQDALPGMEAELLAANAQAQLGLGRMGEASKLINRATESDPDNPRVLMASTTLYLRQNEPGDALVAAERLIEIADTDTRAWNAYASVMQYLGRVAPALDAYKKAVELAPYNIDARLSLIAMHMQLDQHEIAAGDIAYLRENFPKEPRAAYFEAVLASAQGDAERERLALNEAAAGIASLEPAQVLGSPQLMMIGALSNMGMGAYETSVNYLEQYVAANPNDPGAQRLYATSLLALGENNKALRTLLKLNTLYPNDVEIRTITASAYAALGEHEQAAALLSNLDLSGESVDKKYSSQLAVSLLNAGQTGDSIRILESIAASQTDNLGIKLPLAVAYMRARNWSAAEDALRSMLQSAPDDTNTQNLLSICLLSQNRTAQAQALLQSIIDQNPEFLPAQINLAKLYRRQGELNKARVLLNQTLETRPDDGRVLYEFAELSVDEGANTEAIRFAERAFQSAPRNVQFAGLLVRRYLAEGMLQQAEDLAKKVSATSDDKFAGSLLYGRTLSYLGKTKQAALVYVQLSRNVDLNPNKFLQIAQLQSQLGEHESALLTLSTLLSKYPGYQSARQVMLREHLYAGSPERALELAAQYQLDFAEDPIGYLAQAEATLTLGRYQSALAAFSSAEDRGAGTPAILGQYRALQLSEQEQQARSLLERRIAQDANNLQLLAAYSDLLLRAGDWVDAERVLSIILGIDPDGWAHWNNRAFVRQQARLGDAEADARRAVELAPDSPATNDTLGWILVESGQPEDALPFLREAAARDARNPTVRYHLAEALTLLGRQFEAERELKIALQSSSQWSERSLAEALMEKIQKKL